MGYNTTIDVNAFRNELVTHMTRVSEEAQARRATDPDNASWSYTIRDTAIVHTLDLVIKALDNATCHSYEEDK